MSEIKDQYNLLKSKYNLPVFNEIDHVFEISIIDNEHFLLREIRKIIIAKIKSFTDILEDIIHPNSTVSAYHECRFFSEDEKVKLYDLYGKLMGVIRTSNMLEVDSSDELEAKFIQNSFNAWPLMKKELVVIMKKLRDCWSEEEIADTDTSSYFG
jgi:hypothetical protein